MSLILALLAAYAVGSIPAAYIAGRSRGVDLRKHGSGNLGATNVFRVLGPRIGVAVFAFDMAKGAIPVLYFSRWVGTSIVSFPVAQMLCGLAAIMGQCVRCGLVSARAEKAWPRPGECFSLLRRPRPR